MIDEALELAVDVIAEEEGFRPLPYLCPAGIPTVGYGFTVHADGSKVTMEDPLMTEPEARDRLRTMTEKVLASVRAMTEGLDLTPGQEAALCSFAFNLGTHALRQSTLMKMLQAKNVAGAADQFPRWVYAAGKVLPGLVARRERERALFIGAEGGVSPA